MVFNVKNSDRKILNPEDLPFDIRAIPITIPLDDCELFGFLWIPIDAYNGNLKVGTIVEYLPYRVDFTNIRDLVRHPYYAGNGFACLRVDMRGSGNSDGSLKGEYLVQEQQDNLKVFDWIVDQDWSNGKIGQIGKSWGGFNGLQVAYNTHPNLETIITVCSTDDRYADDVHYRGGCMMASDMSWWSSTMFAYNSRPQDPKIKSDWKKNWLERLELEPNLIDWVKHQTRDEFWQNGSICEDYGKVDLPVLMVGGWKDGYTNSIFRMMENLSNPLNKCIIGPWVHEFPDVATPGPNIGYNQIVVSWFHKFLSNNDVVQRGNTEQQKLVWELSKYNIYLQDPVSIKESYDYVPGKWVGYDDDSAVPSVFHVKGDKLTEVTNHEEKVPEVQDGELIITGRHDYGLGRGKWCPFGEPGDFATEQSEEDTKCFTMETRISKDIEVIGHPEIELEIKSDVLVANLSFRLCEVKSLGDSDGVCFGESKLVTWTQTNLNKLVYGMETPQDLDIGKSYKIKLKLDAIGHIFTKGNIIRLGISTTDWPSMWPLTTTPKIKINRQSFKISLPSISYKLVNFPESETMKSITGEIIRTESRTREIVNDLVSGDYKMNDFSDEGERKNINGLIQGSKNWNYWKINNSDSNSANCRNEWEITLRRDDLDSSWSIKIFTVTEMKSDPKNFILYHKIIAYENDIEFFTKSWENEIERVYT